MKRQKRNGVGIEQKIKRYGKEWKENMKGENKS